MDTVISTRGNHEFTTRVRPYPEGTFFSDDKDMEAEGWHRCWADITQEGVFVVYRRFKKGVTVG